LECSWVPKQQKALPDL